VRVEKVNVSKPTEDASKHQPLSEPQVITPCGMSWERDLQIGPAAAGAKAARAQLMASLRNTRKADRRCVEKRQVVKTMRRNIDAPVSDGAAGMSVETPVMGVEQSGGVVRSRSWSNSVTRMSP
jgi:hypothetical protein